MRYSLIAAFIGAVAAVPLTETVYNTQVATITSCGPEVTDCPARKTSSAVPTTTSCTEEQKKSSSWAHPYGPESKPAVPYGPESSSSAPVITSSAPGYGPKSSSAPVVSSSAPVVVSSSAPAPPPYVPESKVWSSYEYSQVLVCQTFMKEVDGITFR